MLVAVVVLLSAVAVFGGLMAVFMNRQAKNVELEALRARLGIKDDSSLLRDHEDEARHRLARLLDESGLGWDNNAFYKWTVTGGVGGALVGSLLGGAPTGFLMCLVGLAVFPAKAILARSKRLSSCDAQMPQALQLMVLALRAGHALPGALALAAREMPNPLRDELRRAVEEQSLGRPMAEVVSRMAGRLPSCDAAQTFAVAIVVLEQTGGNLISVIDRIISGARARTQYKARLRALTSEGRASAMILSMLPLGFFIIAGTLDPNYWHTLFTTGPGHVVLGLVLSLWSLGGLWTYRLVSKEPA